MKNKIKITLIVFLIVLVGFSVDKLILFHKKEEVSTKTNIQKKNTRSLSMMLETGSNTGVYEQTTRSTWPTEGYLFNSELSKCENGSKLSWNDENNTVVMSGNVSDKCYVYFDKYDLAVINSLTEEVTSSSIKLTVNATVGTKPITKYYYSKDNGTSYTESSSNTYAFSGLTSFTTYNMKVYTVDEKGKSSEVYSKTVNTGGTLADVCSNGTNLASCVKTLGNKGSAETSIYIHNSNLTNGAGDNSYRYAGGDYVLTSKATNAGLTTVITADSASTNGVINFYCDGTKQYIGSDCYYPLKYYTLQYDSSNTQYETYLAALTKATSDGYLEENVKNFVCFGSGSNNCSIDNLYRIIGVFGSQVKLIKFDYASGNLLGTTGACASFTANADFTSNYKGNFTTINSYYWMSENYYSNIWSGSALNKTNLNGTYLTNLGTTWTNKIATTTWKVGGNTWTNIAKSPMNTAYQNEIVSPAEATTYSAKIGLMYVSDYGYAASPMYWTYKGNDTVTTDYRAAVNDNWMYMSFYDWTITRVAIDGAADAFHISPDGKIESHSGAFVVRPVFYLNSNVTYSSGDGSSSNPIRVN